MQWCPVVIVFGAHKELRRRSSSKIRDVYQHYLCAWHFPGIFYYNAAPVGLTLMQNRNHFHSFYTSSYTDMRDESVEFSLFGQVFFLIFVLLFLFPLYVIGVLRSGDSNNSPPYSSQNHGKKYYNNKTIWFISNINLGVY